LEGLGRPWGFLSGGTDGRDGPTDAAGALVDDGTLARARAAGLDPKAMLARNDSQPLLDETGDLIRIGGTGTNVADLQILRVG
jgi:hydroxypyruvate reductase